MYAGEAAEMHLNLYLLLWSDPIHSTIPNNFNGCLPTVVNADHKLTPSSLTPFCFIRLCLQPSIFTPLHGMQTRSSDENSVCLSVRLSNVTK